jgi:protein-tyrosine phosphatase
MAEEVTRGLAEATTLADGSPLAARLHLCSRGTGSWHEGEPMDERAAGALVRAGFADHGHVAHQIVPDELGRLDLILALDRRHGQTLLSLGGAHDLDGRLSLLRAFDPAAGADLDVADPYYGDDAEFDRCLARVAAACRGLVDALARSLAP